MSDRDVERVAHALRPRLREAPEVFLTLGSGLAHVADAIADAEDIPVAAVPGLPAPTVAGHAAQLRAGRLAGVPVLAQMGRVHLYEGHPAGVVTRSVEAAALLGCHTYVVTNASGGLDPTLAVGEVVVIDDHLNLTGTSPLTGVLRGGAPLFVDLQPAYDPQLRDAARAAAAARGRELRGVVYAGVRGPQYETAAEVRMLRTLGADVVGMSTVLEVVAARARDLRVLGLSVVTNVHGRGDPTSHEEVLEAGRRAGGALGELVVDVVAGLAR